MYKHVYLLENIDKIIDNQLCACKKDLFNYKTNLLKRFT